MKATLALLTSLLISVSTFAVQDGTYQCATEDNKTVIVYKLATLTTGGLSVPVVEITRTVTTDEGTKNYTIKGAATLVSNDKGEEKLSIGSYLVELTAGRPSCVK
jgi:hypothetical protein